MLAANNDMASLAGLSGISARLSPDGSRVNRSANLRFACSNKSGGFLRPCFRGLANGVRAHRGEAMTENPARYFMTPQCDTQY